MHKCSTHAGCNFKAFAVSIGVLVIMEILCIFDSL